MPIALGWNNLMIPKKDYSDMDQLMLMAKARHIVSPFESSESDKHYFLLLDK